MSDATCGLCRDCRWWSEMNNDDMPDTHKDWGTCDKVDNRTMGQHFAPIHHDTKALARGIEQPWLATAPDFGCVQWQAKEA